jgi:hypothetical protein
MNEANVTQYKETLYRRLTEPVDLFGHELSPNVWWFILVPLLITALFYVGWMYVKDSRSVGWPWAALLGLLRSCVYALLAWVFLLYSEQTWEETQSQAKIGIILDVSNSLTQVVDDIPTKPGEKLPSRQDKVLEFLTSDKVNFVPALEATNPVTAYRFSLRLDDNYLLFRDGRNWTRAEWEDPNRNTAKDASGNPDLPEPKPLAREFWTLFLKPGLKMEPPDGLPAAEKDRYEKLVALNKKLGETGFFNGTNVGDSVLGIVNRELNNRVQGLIVFTDGRSTEESSSAYRDIEKRAKDNHIPIFVVGIGDERPQVRLDLTDLRVPDQVQPEDKFRAVVEVTGEGLADQPVDVELEVTFVRKDGKGKEQEQEIVLVEPEDKTDATKKRVEIHLGKKLVLKPASQPQLDKGTPPRLVVEFPIDARALAEAAKVDLDKGETAGKKWEIGETKDGELRFTARVPRHKLETFEKPFHITEPAALRVVKKPLRVLLFASAPTRDYQFVRTLLVREMEKKRAEVSIYLQLPPGRTERRTGVVQDVEPERLLSEFPTKLEAGKEDKLSALDEYDVIVAFDPDWAQLTERQLKMVETWVDKGGGLIAIGGPINTIQLARPGAFKDKLKPILDLYPVVLKDVRIEDLDRSTSDPWPLNFAGATPEMEFLKLDESDKDLKFLGDWDEFFYGPGKDGAAKGGLQRGFFTYYPVETAKTGALIPARFTDPSSKLKDGSQQPYLVLSDPASHRRVVWIGSGETWRLRQYREAFHERFWAKLLRYAGAGNLGKVSKRIRLEMGPTHVVNKFIEVEAKADGRGGEPLGRDAKPPEIHFTVPDGVPEKELPSPLIMTRKPPRQGADGRPDPGSEGWFSARFQARTAGNYSLTVKVPETGDVQSKRFSVKEANPEMDNTRPDFDQMFRLASEADEVLARMGDTEKAELKSHLRESKPADASLKGEAREDKLRLYFNLKNAHLIPKCMRRDVQTHRNRGPIKDQWDDGVTVWEREPPQPPVKVSYVLLGAVGLLSIEWLIRKLLRLA